MSLFLGTIVQGLVGGCVIALLAGGITVTYRSARVLHLAQGSMATLHAYLYFQATVVWGAPAALALVAVVGLALPIGAAVERAFVRPLASGTPAVRAAGMVGVALILNWVVLTVWGAEQRFLPALSSAGVTLGGVRLGAQHLVIVAVTLATGGGLGYAFARTRWGISLAAAADDPEAARLCGIASGAVARRTFALSSALAALAGILVTPLLVLTPSQMTLLSVIALGAALAGGFESLPRTVVAGLAIGVVQALVTTYAPDGSTLPQAAGFACVLAVLAVARRRTDLIDLLRGTA
jgi:branched-chain amino acid transport system permease protein